MLNNIYECFYSGLYGMCQQKNLPTTPGIHWTLKNEQFKKNVMMSGVSLGQLQWITYMQHYDNRFKDKDGNLIQIEHAYYRGEYKVKNYAIDGYASTEDCDIFLEYLGCHVSI